MVAQKAKGWYILLVLPEGSVREVKIMNRETASFAEKIKKIRSERNETQRQFGLITGFSSSYVCKLEKGKANPSHSSLVQLSEKLNLPPAYFF